MGMYQQVCEIFHAVNVYKGTASGSFSAYTLLKENREEMGRQYEYVDI